MKPLEAIQYYDVSLINKLISYRFYPTLVKASRTVSKLGDGWMYVVIGLTSLAINGLNDPYFWALALAFAIERPIYYVLKNSLKRDRPFKLQVIKNHVVPSDQFSFPSGHTSAAFLFIMITAGFVPVLFVPLFISALLIGCSRVILGVHYPTDILVGMFMGISIAKLVSLYLI
ncbi:phosphatase PAP2 family protein [Marinicella sp. W31]|uniref:phosphatase PAP2 family protein n=1 Tax=Marinicella sp. W31 TaxID=3023713 RepID=UPI003756AB97